MEALFERRDGARSCVEVEGVEEGESDEDLRVVGRDGDETVQVSHGLFNLASSRETGRSELEESRRVGRDDERLVGRFHTLVPRLRPARLLGCLRVLLPYTDLPLEFRRCSVVLVR